MNSKVHERVVISGMSGAFPDAPSIKKLSEVLYDKVNPVKSVDNRWSFDHPEAPKYLGQICDLKHFDAQFFKINYRLSNSLDTMTRKLLENTYQALFDAGINPEQFNGKKVGVFVSTMSTESENALIFECQSVTGLRLLGSSKCMLANFISYWLNVTGPSVHTNAGYTGSMTALAQAWDAISRGYCEAAIVGTTQINLHPHPIICSGRESQLSKDDRTQSFDQNASGAVMSDAIGVLILQKEKDALRIYGEVVHIESEFNCPFYDEESMKLSERCGQFMKKVLHNSEVPPQSVGYVEAYGSAIAQIDKAELEAIAEVYCKGRTDPLPVGSVMSNIGNTSASSGVCSVIKVLLGFYTGEMAGNLHYDLPRQDVAAIHEGRLQVNTEHLPFHQEYVAVNNMYYGGNLAHLILKKHFKPKDESRYKCEFPRLVLLSGRQEECVKHIVDDLSSRPVDAEEIALLNRMSRYNVNGHLGRGYVILDTVDNETKSLSSDAAYVDNRRPLWFVYSGMGSQWAGMAVKLMRIPIFAAAIERCRKVLEPKGLDIVEIITSPDKAVFDNILHSFVGIAAVQIGITDILRELNIVPDGIIGHSVGELGCGYADGCFTAEEMILCAYSRGMASLETEFIYGSMAAIGMGYQKMSNIVPKEIEVACHNSNESCTISGPADKVQEFVKQLTEEKIFAKEVPCSNIAYHSRYIAKAGPVLLEKLEQIITSPKPRSSRWLSTSVPQNNWTDPEAQLCSAVYHTNNLLNPVLFEETLRLVPRDAILVEIAPHGLLQAILKRALPPTSLNIALTNRNHSDNALLLLEGIGKLYMMGLNPDVEVLYPKVEFPVSSQTPMLSHLVTWAHQEEWLAPICVRPRVVTTAISKMVVSIYDEEYSYLKGCQNRGKTVYPFSAALVNVWDTLAMSLNEQRKNISVQFNDLHLYSQPILRENNAAHLLISIQKANGRFEVLHDDVLVIAGSIQRMETSSLIENKNKNIEARPLPFKSDVVYQLLYEKELLYKDDFKCIHSINSDVTEADIIWNDNWVTFIDGIIQMSILRSKLNNAEPRPCFIRELLIALNEHYDIVRENTNKYIPATRIDLDDSVRCGGVVIKELKFYNMPLGHHATEHSDSESLFIDKEGSKLFDNCNANDGMMLQSSKLGDFSSLHWVQAPKLGETGVNVTVHYAGISDYDMKCAAGTIISKSNKLLTDACYGVDFSGVTSSGVRVMGLVEDGSMKTNLRAHPELLWPVPAHWSLEDAATVPLAYGLVFYCIGNIMRKPGYLAFEGVGCSPTHVGPTNTRTMVSLADVEAIKNTIRPEMKVLIHGGTGAFGQAAISVALACNATIFTTVSSLRKKRFLKKLFPQLEEENIGNSRDTSFKDMVMFRTQGKGCHVVFNCTKSMKNESFKCCGLGGYCFDISPGQPNENDVLEMNTLTDERSYDYADIFSLFKSRNDTERKAIQRLISEGIVNGYVRPLTRVTYTPAQVTDAFELLAASRHCGRVLIDLQQYVPELSVKSRISCNPSLWSVISFDDEIMGMRWAERLLARGARKLHLFPLLDNQSSYLKYKVKYLENAYDNVQIKISPTKNINNAFTNGGVLIEGIFLIFNTVESIHKNALKQLAVPSKHQSIKYTALVTSNRQVGEHIFKTNREKFTTIVLPEIKTVYIPNEEDSIALHTGIDKIEEALGLSTTKIIVKNKQRTSLLMEIAKICGIDFTNANEEASLQELGFKKSHLKAVSFLLWNDYNVFASDHYIPGLTSKRLREIGGSVAYDCRSGLEGLLSNTFNDELLADTSPIFVSTLDNFLHDDLMEICTTKTYLIIVPGLESLYTRFINLCKPLKIAALVLQPKFGKTQRTAREQAEIYYKEIEDLIKKDDSFYVLGYECGVPAALQLTAILEDHGKKGTVFCLGYGPDELRCELKLMQSRISEEMQFEEALVRRIVLLNTGENINAPKDILYLKSSWKERLRPYIYNILGHCKSSHTSEYIISAIERAQRLWIQAVIPFALKSPLKSQIVFIRARFAQSTSDNHLSETSIQCYSSEPVVVYDLETPLEVLENDTRCSFIINSHLDSKILNDYKTKNTCDTYNIDREIDYI